MNQTTFFKKQESTVLKFDRYQENLEDEEEPTEKSVIDTNLEQSRKNFAVIDQQSNIEQIKTTKNNNLTTNNVAKSRKGFIELDIDLNNVKDFGKPKDIKEAFE